MVPHVVLQLSANDECFENMGLDYDGGKRCVTKDGLIDMEAFRRVSELSFLNKLFGELFRKAFCSAFKKAL